MLAHELVEATVPQQGVPVLATSTPCDGPGASPSRRTRGGAGGGAANYSWMQS